MAKPTTPSTAAMPAATSRPPGLWPGRSVAARPETANTGKMSAPADSPRPPRTGCLRWPDAAQCSTDPATTGTATVHTRLASRPAASTLTMAPATAASSDAIVTGASSTVIAITGTAAAAAAPGQGHQQRRGDLGRSGRLDRRAHPARAGGGQQPPDGRRDQQLAGQPPHRPASAGRPPGTARRVPPQPRARPPSPPESPTDVASARPRQAPRTRPRWPQQPAATTAAGPRDGLPHAPATAPAGATSAHHTTPGSLAGIVDADCSPDGDERQEFNSTSGQITRGGRTEAASGHHLSGGARPLAVRPGPRLDLKAGPGA